MKRLQTVCASLLLIIVLGMTAFAQCPNGGIMGTGGVCISGIMGTGGTGSVTRAGDPSVSEPKTPDADVFELLRAAELSIWQCIVGVS